MTSSTNTIEGALAPKHDTMGPVAASGSGCGCGCGPGCREALTESDTFLQRACKAKLIAVGGASGCPGGAIGRARMVDLVILADTSTSMRDEAIQLSNAVDAAIRGAQKHCPMNLRVVWLGIEGTVTGTQFTETLRHHLHGLSVSDDHIKSKVGDHEDGAAAISDLCDHFNWRDGAARAILFLGDEGLLRGNPQDAADVIAADEAIADARAAAVRVHMFAGTGIGVAAAAEYSRVAASTCGHFFRASAHEVELQAGLEKLLCASSACPLVRIPRMQPCFELRWGDRPDGALETDDFQVLCITACNPYGNVCFKDVQVVAIAVTDTKGTAVSGREVLVKPSAAICFGNLAACGDGQRSCASREVVLKTSRAHAGGYQIHLEVCFSAEFPIHSRDSFAIHLTK